MSEEGMWRCRFCGMRNAAHVEMCVCPRDLLRSRIGELEEALRPFADIAEMAIEQFGLSAAYESYVWPVRVTLLLDAEVALLGKEAEGE